MSEICTDNRFEVIAVYKKKLMERTNIETSPDEMAVIDNVLFRFWQLGWLPPVPHGRLIDADALYREIKAECNPYGKPSIGYDDGLKVLGIIGSTPPVIPAEETSKEATNDQNNS